MKFASFKDFFEARCTAGTDFFQVVKFSSISCHFHSPICGTDKITERYLDPFSYDDNGTERYNEGFGFDPAEKYLPSVVIALTNQAPNILFPPTVLTAKNVGVVIVCHKCQRPRLLYAKKMVSDC